MIRRLNRFLRLTHTYDDPLVQERAQALLYYIAGATFLAGLAALFVVGLNATRSQPLGFVEAVAIFSPFMLGIFYSMVQRGLYSVVGIGIVLLGLFSQITTINSGLNTAAMLALMLPLVTAGVLLGWRSTLLTTIVLYVIIALASFLNPQTSSGIADFFVVSLIVSIAALLLIVFSNNVQVAASRFIAEIGAMRRLMNRLQKSGTAQTEMEYALTALNLLRDELDLALVQLYFADFETITNRLTSGLGGFRGDRSDDIRLTEDSAIYDAIMQKRTIIVTPELQPIKRQHVLPGVQYALAVPVIADGRVLAVLDVQSEAATGFADTEQQMIELVAGQLALVINRTRLIASLREEISGQERLIQNQRDRLARYEQEEERATTVAWQTYLQQRGLDYLGFDVQAADQTPNLASTLDDNLKQALQTGDITVRTENGIQLVSVPILLRGRSLGAMSFRVPEGTQVIGPRQRELVRSVVQRLALALENKRLFEQSQSQAQRESTANQIGNLLLSSRDIDTVMQMAAENFNEALGAVTTHIRLQPDAITTEESA